MITRKQLFHLGIGYTGTWMLGHPLGEPKYERLLDGIPSTEPAASGMTLEWLQEVLDQHRTKTGVPALGCVVVSRDGVLAQAVTGVRRTDKDNPVHRDSRWQLGSISKIFAATAVAILVEQGKFDWNSTLGALLPELRSDMAPGVADIMVRQIICHRSGLMRDGGSFVPREAGLTPTEQRYKFAARIVKEKLLYTPGARYSYSNIAYSVLSVVVERATGKVWEDALHTLVLDPLGIKRACFFEPAMQAPDTEPWPHVRDTANGGNFVPAQLLDLDTERLGWTSIAPSGLSLSLEDAALWLRTHLTTDNFGGLLNRDTARRLYQPINGTADNASDNDSIPALAYHMWPNGIGAGLSHEGTNGRNEAVARLFRSQGIGYLIATNCRALFDRRSTGELEDILVDRLFPGRWIKRSVATPEPAEGAIEGEHLDVVRIDGGDVQFQADRRDSGGFHLLWSGAARGQQLVLRGRVPRAGSYVVSATCIRNVDLGSTRIAIGDLSVTQSFQADHVGWARTEFGTTHLEAGTFDLVITALEDAGTGAMRCHLALDALGLFYKV